MATTVFLCDDHSIVREGLRLILEREADLKVVGEADNGVTALRRVLELRPSVAIVDVSMPGNINGIDATQRIRREVPETRVVILSMYSSADYVGRALRVGAHGYVLKASATTDIVAAVRAVVAGERYLSPGVEDELLNTLLSNQNGAAPELRIEKLSVREREVLQLVVEGKSSVEIAELLGLSPSTVDTYRSRLMQKLQVANLPDLVRLAIREGLLPLDH
jgi:DNA-binding NarL/FixJ family response regulator